MFEVDVVTAVVIDLVATEVAGLHGEGILIKCTTVENTDCRYIADYNSSSISGTSSIKITRYR